MSTVTRVVVDTSTLESVCKTDHSSVVFHRLPLCTTDVCFEEVKRNRSSTDDRSREEALQQVLSHYREFDTPSILRTSITYEPHVEDQGEDSILDLLESSDTDNVRYVFLFDFDATDDIREEVGGTGIEVNTPARAFELLHDGEFISEEEFYEAVRQMSDAEGWEGQDLVETLASTTYEDVFGAGE